MENYTIIISPDAEADLIALRNYIAFTLLAPDTALSYIRFLKKEISSLSYMPERNKLLDTEPWHSRGIRRIIAKNFYIYYRIDEVTMTVFILNVIYSKRDQLKTLSHIYPEDITT